MSYLYILETTNRKWWPFLNCIPCDYFFYLPPLLLIYLTAPLQSTQGWAPILLCTLSWACDLCHHRHTHDSYPPSSAQPALLTILRDASVMTQLSVPARYTAFLSLSLPSLDVTLNRATLFRSHNLGYQIAVLSHTWLCIHSFVRLTNTHWMPTVYQALSGPWGSETQRLCSDEADARKTTPWYKAGQGDRQWLWAGPLEQSSGWSEEGAVWIFGEEGSKQREQHVKRPWGSSILADSRNSK